ncbi:MAG: type 4a pilus biogenesis protein PilO [Deltaproteobacteria bacterium]|nr:type 4a pilus biogenesis protein PilO [Deltaproteobacteria bacterium]
MAITADSLIKLPPMQKAYILVGTLALIAGLYWYLLYNPKTAELAELNLRQEKLQAELIESMAIAADLPRFEAEVTRLNDELKKALLELPDKKEIPSLLTNISKLGIESGLEFIRFKPMNEVPSGFYAKVPVEISVKGTFHALAVFFDKVSRLSRIVNITEADIGGAKDEGGKVILTTPCLATTYRFIEGESAKK